MTVEAELHDGRILEFPDGTSPSVVQATVKKVLGQSPGLLERAGSIAKSVVEPALAMASGATTGLVGRMGGAIGGIAGSIVTGKYGTREGAQMAAQTAEDTAHKFTYEPRTPEGKEALAAIGKLFHESKLGGLGPSEAISLSGLAPATRPAVRQVAAPVENAAANVAERVAAIGSPAEREMSGGGSASVFEDTLRRQRAADLPVPIKLTKGQAERTFEQQQFERETAKNPTAGEPLRQRFAAQNKQILQNFDAWVDMTGAEAGSLRATGQVVTDAVVNKSKMAKAHIRTAYDKAQKSGAMAEEVNVSPLRSYLAEHQPEAINAPIITSAESKLNALLGKDGQSISINSLEEVRKMVGNLSSKDATNAHFGKELKKVIDQMTEGRGGALYKQARALRFRYGNEFEQQGVIEKLLSKKTGTNDKAVALEDVFSHSIMKGSLDDVRAVRKTLQTAGPEGQQAWRELQGATVKHLKDEVSKSVSLDINGNPIISAHRLNTLVNELDKDGKLDFVFGKKGAQQIRDVNGIAKDVFTSPPGSVNHSNTASILAGLFDVALTASTGVPAPVGSALTFGARKLKEYKLSKRVFDALQEPQ